MGRLKDKWAEFIARRRAGKAGRMLDYVSGAGSTPPRGDIADAVKALKQIEARPHSESVNVLLRALDSKHEPVYRPAAAKLGSIAGLLPDDHALKKRIYDGLEKHLYTKDPARHLPILLAFGKGFKEEGALFYSERAVENVLRLVKHRQENPELRAPRVTKQRVLKRKKPLMERILPRTTSSSRTAGTPPSSRRSRRTSRQAAV